MITAAVCVTLKDDIDHKDYEDYEARMMAIGTQMPGFVEIKEFNSKDGRESLMMVTFETREQMIAWRDHPEHKATQARGRRLYFSDYDVKISEVKHHYTYKDGERVVHGVF